MTDADNLYGQEHIDTYRATDGETGHDWKGAEVLLLTTTGRKSGEPRTTPLIYRRDGGNYLIVASKGGSDDPPAWYLNLEQNPTVQLQVKGDHITARARDATSEEKPALWKLMTEKWPDYDAYQRTTEREIPVVVLEPA
jgi:deazaflavin-dependent oxidoreductase (nitroreductase family)